MEKTNISENPISQLLLNEHERKGEKSNSDYISELKSWIISCNRLVNFFASKENINNNSFSFVINNLFSDTNWRQLGMYNSILNMIF